MHNAPLESPTVPLSPEPSAPKRRTQVRWLIVTILFLVTSINFADRATLSITASAITNRYGFSPVVMGYLFSIFGWSYVMAQLPGGWLLDRWGAKRVYMWSLFLWSVCTLLHGLVGFVFASSALALGALFACRFLVGLAEAPSMPANSRIVASWFPESERGTSVALFNAAQYFAGALFIPIMGSITYHFSWEYTFLFMGCAGLLFVPVMRRMITDPATDPRVNEAERDYIARGGSVEANSSPHGGNARQRYSAWASVKVLLANRMMVGIFLGQYCINTLTTFFLTWFPAYLVKERGMSILQVGFVAVLPALLGCAGGLVGGAFSDYLLRRGYSLSVARKTPIVAGLLLSTCMVGCNFARTDVVVVAIMALAYFGKGLGALGWSVVVDTAPKEIMGLTCGLFNFFGNVAAITTPIIIGYIVAQTGSYNGALVFVSVNAVVAVASFLFLVPSLHRMKLPAAFSTAVTGMSPSASC